MLATVCSQIMLMPLDFVTTCDEYSLDEWVSMAVIHIPLMSAEN